MVNINDIESFVSQIIKAIVSVPDDVKTAVKKQDDNEEELFTIHVRVNPVDVGLCIGEGGKTAESLRRIVGLAGHRALNVRVYTKIDAPKVPDNYFV